VKNRLRFCRAILALLIASWVLEGVSIPAFAQESTAIEDVAARTTKEVEKSRPMVVLVAPLRNCIVDAPACSAFEDALRLDLKTSSPGLQIISHDDAVSFLKNKGLMSIDAYDMDVLEIAALGLRAGILIGENLDWKHSHYEMTSEVLDVVEDKDIAKLSGRIAPKAPDFGNEPVLIKDPETGVSRIVREGNNTVFRFPTCEKCPDPPYTEAARKKGLQGQLLFLATISAQGIVEQLVLVKGFDKGLSDSAAETIRNWRFKPAIGVDGRPFPARVPIQVKFLFRSHW
jgi:TonB family protein